MLELGMYVRSNKMCFKEKRNLLPINVHFKEKDILTDLERCWSLRAVLFRHTGHYMPTFAVPDR